MDEGLQARRQSVASRVAKHAIALRPDLNISIVARRINLSRQTISDFLNDRRPVSDETMIAVMEVAGLPAGLLEAILLGDTGRVVRLAIRGLLRADTAEFVLEEMSAAGEGGRPSPPDLDHPFSVGNVAT